MLSLYKIPFSGLHFPSHWIFLFVYTCNRTLICHPCTPAQMTTLHSKNQQYVRNITTRCIYISSLWNVMIWIIKRNVKNDTHAHLHCLDCWWTRHTDLMYWLYIFYAFMKKYLMLNWRLFKTAPFFHKWFGQLAL